MRYLKSTKNCCQLLAVQLLLVAQLLLMAQTIPYPKDGYIIVGTIGSLVGVVATIAGVVTTWYLKCYKKRRQY